MDSGAKLIQGLHKIVNWALSHTVDAIQGEFPVHAG
jgi:hypothetical protein